MLPTGTPTARGDLSETPFAHLAVYSLERRLDGELFLTEGDGIVHAVRFEDGAPVKIRMGNSLARLGDLLVERGLVARDVVEGAVAFGGLLGDALVLSGYVEPAALATALADQFRLRNAALYALPASTTFAFFEGATTLVGWGGEPHRVDPLALFWSGLRAHGASSAQRSTTLDRLGARVLELHPRTSVGRMGLEPDAEEIVGVLAVDPCPYEELLLVDGVEPELVRSLVYALCITRQVDLGVGALPVAVEDKPANLARMKLKSRAVRAGVAVDAPVEATRSMRPSLAGGRKVIPRDEDAHLSSPPPPSTEQLVASAPTPSSESDDGASSGVRELGGLPASESSVVAPMPGSLAPLDAATAREILERAREHVERSEWKVALELLDRAIEPLEAEYAEGYREAMILRSTARLHIPGADLKGSSIDLDVLIRERDDSAPVRFLRATARRKLGDSQGALLDLRRAVELDPSHAAAHTALEALEATVAGASSGSREKGFFKRLFGG